MMIIPMKWMPCLLVLCAVYCLFVECNILLGLVMGAIGGAWLYFKHAGA